MISEKAVSNSCPELLTTDQAVRQIDSTRETSPTVALLTGGGDRPYALGMASALISQSIHFDFIGSDEHITPDLVENPYVNFLNLRGGLNSDATAIQKVIRVLVYYFRLVKYALSAKPKVFHILWHNKFEFFDRTVLLPFYRLMGKSILFTAHNVNAAQRDGKDGLLNRISLKAQYRFVNHIFVHTEKMKVQLLEEFGVPAHKVGVIPFGINNTVPNGRLTSEQAKLQLRFTKDQKVILFFGGITPYKGLQYLVSCLAELAKGSDDYHLIIAGKPKEGLGYWKTIQEQIQSLGLSNRVTLRTEHIPDENVELYFKAADILILPYTHIFQSGVLFLGYSFGLPVIASDVGSLREDIFEGETGYLCKPCDSSNLALKVKHYFSSELYSDLERRRNSIKRFANERYSWSKVASIVVANYKSFLDK